MSGPSCCPVGALVWNMYFCMLCLQSGPGEPAVTDVSYEEGKARGGVRQV